jgi:hypothetical protein
LPGHVSESWAYPGIVFEFLGMRTFGVTCFDDPDYRKAQLDREPSRWTNIAYVRIDSLPFQTARFRAPGDSVDVFVAAYASVTALRAASDLNAAVNAQFWLHAWDSADSLTAAMTLNADGMLRWTPRVPAGRYDFRVETAMPGSLVAGRAMMTLQTGRDSTNFDTQGFGISDVLLAARTEVAATATRWSDARITPIVDGVVEAGDVTLLWENYELGRSGASARYGVEIRIERVVRAQNVVGRIAAQIVGGIAGVVGLNRRDDADGVTFEFERDVPYSVTLLDQVSLSVAGTPPGRYTLALILRDRISGQTTSRTTKIEVR